MKTLNQIAESFGLYQVKDIPERYKNQYFEHKVKIGNAEIPEFITKLENYESGLFYECRQDTSYTGEIIYYIDHSYVLVKKNDSDLILMLKSDYRSKKHSFYPYYNLVNKYNAINYEIRNSATKEIKEPNYIGVFTEKKVNDWFIYFEKYMQALESAFTEVQDKNKEIEDKIKAFISSVPGCNVTTYQNKTFVKTDLFYVTFEHQKDQKYLSTKMEFRGSLGDITKIHNALAELA
jgi:hypothetical protein